MTKYGNPGLRSQMRKRQLLPMPTAGPLPKTCQWPLWPDSGPLPSEEKRKYCGKTTMEGKSYCEAHQALSRTKHVTPDQKTSKFNGLRDFSKGSPGFRGGRKRQI